jgi:N6-L-threonylcarbamoyladenine synthase
MIILGIETSCDDTGISIVKATPQKSGVKFDILSNIVSSQIKTHAPFGGVVPNLAAREHLKNIEPCLKTALKETNKKISDIDLIAVTIGPGLIPSLLIGVNFAKALAYKYNIPIIGVNHIEGHIIAAFPAFAKASADKPAIALTVSGGHTQLVLIKGGHPAKSGASYKIIGETLDDAAGECFDKVAKLLNLGYPGGPVISTEAEKVRNSKSEIRNFKLPRPMIQHKNYDFSFSGLKTAVLYLIRDNKNKLKDKNFIQEVCYETQQAIIDVLIDKTLRAAKEYKVKTIILAGGVAANQKLREQMAQEIKRQIPNAKFLIPDFKLCTDNGTMIAMAGYYNRKSTSKNYNKVRADANLRI